jgi:hypothetical protein
MAPESVTRLLRGNVGWIEIVIDHLRGLPKFQPFIAMEIAGTCG